MLTISYDHRNMADVKMTLKDEAINEFMSERGFEDVGSGASWKQRDLEFEAAKEKEIAFLTDFDAHNELQALVGDFEIDQRGGGAMA